MTITSWLYLFFILHFFVEFTQQLRIELWGEKIRVEDAWLAVTRALGGGEYSRLETQPYS